MYNKMRSVSLISETRDTIFTIKWDQYPYFIDTRHYIYNKMRSVPSLYRLTRHYIYNKMRSVPGLYRHETLYLQ